MDGNGAVRSESLQLRMMRSPGDIAAGPARSWPQSIRDFELLIDSLQHRLVHFAFCRLHSLEDAEDVVQDVLVQAYRDRERYRKVENVDPFLFRMVANRCTDLLRRHKREAGPMTGAGIEAMAGGAPEPVDAAARLRLVESMLGRLPDRQAEVIRLRVHGGLAFDAVARAVGCSVPTVKSRFRYGIQKLRRVLKQQGGGR